MLVGLVFPFSLACAFFAPTPPVQAHAPPSAAADAAREAEDARARAVFEKLALDKRRELLDFFELELRPLRSFQVSLVRFVLKKAALDTAQVPAASEAPFFDPTKHAPQQPIARRRLDPQSAPARQAHTEILGSMPVRRLASGFAYDYAMREVV